MRKREGGRGRRVGLRSTVPSDRRSVAQIDRWKDRYTYAQTDRQTYTHTQRKTSNPDSRIEYTVQ